MRRDPFDPYGPRDQRQTPDRRRLPPDQEAQALREALAEARAEAEKLRAELKTVSARYVELQGDFERYRGKVQEMADEAQRVGRDAVLIALVEVADDLERALASNPDKDSAWATGTAAVLEGVRRRLEQYGVRRYATPGDRFDPEIHDAVGAVQGTPFDPDTIVGVERSGYRSDTGVLRPAKVIVAKAWR